MTQPVGFLGLGFYVPQRVMTNAELEKLVETSDEWIRTRTGISERRIAAEGENTSDLALKATQAALQDAKLKPTDLDLLLVATMTPDMPCPSTACILQAKLGAPQAAAMDVAAACSGFLFGLVMAQQFVASGTYKHVLVVGAEVLSRVVDWTDRGTCVLFGDGAGAAVIGRTAQGKILSTILGSDGTKVDLLKVPGGGTAQPASIQSVEARAHFLKMNGTEVFKHAVRGMADAAHEAIRRAGIQPEQVTCVVPHQANVRIIEAVVKKAGIPMEKVFLNVDRYGNMSAASTIVALCEAVQSGRIKKGDYVLLVVFGAGLTWGAAVLQW
ncbi:MAG: beta-ketoacyl-ACP synthase III [Candidatus Omnitrophota bacterium]|nr:beta-ketoacyl-ACP synthase III [Candidatus Omnitrophota bacterium]